MINDAFADLNATSLKQFIDDAVCKERERILRLIGQWLRNEGPYWDQDLHDVIEAIAREK